MWSYEKNRCPALWIPCSRSLPASGLSIVAPLHRHQLWMYWKGGERKHKFGYSPLKCKMNWCASVLSEPARLVIYVEEISFRFWGKQRGSIWWFYSSRTMEGTEFTAFIALLSQNLKTLKVFHYRKILLRKQPTLGIQMKGNYWPVCCYIEYQSMLVILNFTLFLKMYDWVIKTSGLITQADGKQRPNSFTKYLSNLFRSLLRSSKCLCQGWSCFLISWSIGDRQESCFIDSFSIWKYN